MDDKVLNDYAILLVEQYQDRINFMKNTPNLDKRAEIVTVSTLQDQMFNSLLAGYEELEDEVLNEIEKALINAVSKSSGSSGFFNVGKGEA